jgi:hypothetical protein
MRRLLTLFIIMAALLLSQTATPPMGAGTAPDPYQIASLENLYWLSQTQSAWSSHFVQTADIDAATTAIWDNGRGFTPIGNATTKFSGTYDGQGFAIDGLKIDRESTSYVGLFGYAQNTGNPIVIKNLQLDAAQIQGLSYVAGVCGYFAGDSLLNIEVNDIVVSQLDNWYAGAVAGRVYLSGLNPVVQNCHVSGSVSGLTYVGGLLGSISNFDYIDNCSFSGTVSANDINTSIKNYFGGLFGYGNGGGRLSNSSATVVMQGSSIESRYFGGLVGQISAIDTLINCSATGQISCTTGEGSSVGGFIGSVSSPLYIARNVSTVSLNINQGYQVGGFLGILSSMASGGKIVENYAIADILNNNPSSTTRLGGFIGFASNNGEINRCFYEGSIALPNSADSRYNGGFFGQVTGSGKIANCFSHGEITAESARYLGGFAGSPSLTIDSSYCAMAISVSSPLSYVNAFVGYASGSITNSYYDVTLEPDLTETYATAKTTTQMKTEAELSGLDFVNIWEMLPESYPSHQWLSQTAAGRPVIFSVSDSAVLGQSATLKSEISPNNATTNYQFKYGSSSGTYTMQTLLTSIGSGYSAVPVSASIIGLSPQTTYYFIVEASNAEGSTASLEQSFTTAPATTVPSGVGNALDPYDIASIENLTWLMLSPSAWAAHCSLSTDIDLAATSGWNSGEGFSPIGNTDIPFTGSFDGNGFVLSNLYINNPESNGSGLFGVLNGANIRELGISNATLTAPGLAGGLAGKANAGTTIEQCFTSAEIEISGSAGESAGGLVGVAENSHIIDCYTKGSLTVAINTNYAGGLCGRFSKTSGQSATLSYSYSAMTIDYRSSSYQGGLLGSYSTSGTPLASIAELYWDTEVSMAPTSAGGLGIGKTTAQMKSQSTFAFDFVDNWGIAESVTYPYLRWQESSLSLPPSVDLGTIFDLTASSATIGATINPNNNATTYNVKYGTSPGVYPFSTTTKALAAGGAPIGVNPIINGLAFLTTYYYRVVASNVEGSTESTEGVFTTLEPLTAPNGSGTAPDPYVITTPGHVNWFSQNSSSWNKVWTMGTSVNIAGLAALNNGKGLTPIGNNSKKFTGSFDGNGFTLSNLTIDNSDGELNEAGLFGYVDGATIENINLSNVNVSGVNYTAGLIGNGTKVTINNCFVSGQITASGQYVGGLAGRLIGDNNSYTQLSNVEADIVIHTNSPTHYLHIGGLVGRIEYYDISSILFETEIYVSENGHSLDDGYMGGAFGSAISVNAEGASGTVVIEDTDTQGYDYYGGFAGSLSCADYLRNVDIVCNISGNGQQYGGLSGFQLFASSTDVAIDNCSIAGSISGSQDIGGVFGYMKASSNSTGYIAHCTDITSAVDITTSLNHAGGGIGRIQYGYASYLFEDWQISGDVVSGGQRAGGMIGLIDYYYGSPSPVFRNCSASGDVSGLIDVGGFVGSMEGGVISNCQASGSIESDNRAGGFAGYLDYDSRVDSYIDSSFATGSSVIGDYYVGGFVGWNVGFLISESYTQADVLTEFTGVNNAYLGGFVGYSSSNGQVTNCYAKGKLMAINDGNPINPDVGGFVGNSNSSTFTNCYSSGKVDFPAGDLGGFAGKQSSSTFTSCFWDKDSSYQSTSAGGTGQTHAQMLQQATFDPPWDFVNTWGLIAASEYPYLQWQTAEVGQPPALGNIYSSHLEADSARVYATIYPNGEETTYKAQYRPIGGSYTDTPTGLLAAGISGTNVTFTIKSLQADTRYAYRFVATNTNGTTISSEYEFRTLIETTVPAGSGTDVDPYLLTSIGNLLWVSAHPSSWGDVFALQNDIDCAGTAQINGGAGMEIIGRETQPFTGKLHGNGYELSNLTLNWPDSNFVGLIGYADNAEIDSLGLTEVAISGNEQVGALIGHADNSSMIRTSYSTGSIEGSRNVGGLVGWLASNSEIDNSFSHANSIGNVSTAGGLVGYNAQGIVDTCYALGAVSSTANAGGLIGESFSGVSRASYWDKQASGQLASAGGEVGKSSSEMQLGSTFSGWNFIKIWRLVEQTTFPHFATKSIDLFAASRFTQDALEVSFVGVGPGIYTSPTIIYMDNNTPFGNPPSGIVNVSVYSWEISGSGTLGATAVHARIAATETAGIVTPENVTWLQREFNQIGEDWTEIATAFADGIIETTLSLGEYPAGGIGVLALGSSTGDNSLPVELGTLSANGGPGQVTLQWVTESEVDNLGFTIFRRHGNDAYSEVASYRSDDDLRGLGTTAAGQIYTYVDNDPGLIAGDTYVYRLTSTDRNGQVHYHPEVEAVPELIAYTFEVRQNYPNPFNPRTTIEITVAELIDQATVEVYDILGRKIKTLFDGPVQQHRLRLLWEGDNEHGNRVGSGVYFYRYRSATHNVVRKMMLLR